MLNVPAYKKQKKRLKDTHGIRSRLLMNLIKSLIISILCLFALSLTAQDKQATAKSTEDYIQDLSSNDVYLQKQACQHLAKKKEASAIDPLLFLLEEETVDKHVRVAAAHTLSVIDGENKTILSSFLRIAQKDKVPEVRYAVFLSLGKFYEENKNLPEVKELILEMERSTDPYLQDLGKKLRAKQDKKS